MGRAQASRVWARAAASCHTDSTQTRNGMEHRQINIPSSCTDKRVIRGKLITDITPSRPPHGASGLHGQIQIHTRAQVPVFSEPERDQSPELEFLEKSKSKLVYDKTVARQLRGATERASAGGHGGDDEAEVVEAMGRIHSIAGLEAFLVSQAQALSMVQVTAALVRLAKLGRHAGTHRAKQPETASCWPLLELLLLPQLQRVVWSLDAQGVSNALWALSKLGSSKQLGLTRRLDLSGARRGLLEELLSVAGAKAAEMNAQNMSNTLYALALLEQQHPVLGRRTQQGKGDEPPPPQQQQQQQQQEQGRERPSHGPPGQQRLIAASYLQPLLDACGPKLYMFGAQALSNTIWALARLGCHPTSAWLHAFFERSAFLMQELQPRHMANITWALHKLRAQPPPDWVDRLLLFSARTMHKFSYRDLANCAWGLANLGIVPPDAWVGALCAAAAAPATAGAADAGGVAGMLFALSHWRAQPSEQFLEALFLRSASPRALIRFSGPQLSDVARSLARLRIMPPGPWSSALLLRLQAVQQEQGLSPKVKTELVGALASLGLPRSSVLS